MIRSFLVAFQFLTIIPVNKNLQVTEELLSRSTIFFPLVGLFIGGFQAFVFLGLHSLLSPSVTSLLLLLTSVILTGALHIEGFADMIDGFLCRQDKEEKLRIMRDSRIGAMGVIGVICLLLAKYIFLREIVGNLNPLLVVNTLLLIPCLSRWAMVIAAGISQYARSIPGLGRVAASVKKKEVLLSSLTPLGVTCILYLGLNQHIPAGAWDFVGIIITILLAFLLSRWAKSKVGGVTGDILGGINEIIEVYLLLAVTIVASFLLEL